MNRPALQPGQRHVLARAYFALLVIERDYPDTRVAGHARAAKRRLRVLLGYDRALGRVLVDRAELDRRAAANPPTEAELRLMYGDR